MSWIVFPRIEGGGAAVSDMNGVASGEIEVMLDGCGGEHGVDDSGRMAGETFGFATDGSPAEDYLVRNGEDTAREPAFKSEYGALDFLTQVVTGRQVYEALLKFAEGQDA